MVNSKANMLVIQKMTRIITRVFVMTANGSASTANNINNMCTMISVTAVRLIHSAVPNTSDLARCVLQQQRSAATAWYH